MLALLKVSFRDNRAKTPQHLTLGTVVRLSVLVTEIVCKGVDRQYHQLPVDR